MVTNDGWEIAWFIFFLNNYLVLVLTTTFRNLTNFRSILWWSTWLLRLSFINCDWGVCFYYEGYLNFCSSFNVSRRETPFLDWANRGPNREWFWVCAYLRLFMSYFGKYRLFCLSTRVQVSYWIGTRT